MSNRGYHLNGLLEIPGAGKDSWAHPVIANGRLYLREQDTLWVYDLRREAQAAESAATKHESTPSIAVSAIRKLGVSVETLSVSESGRRIYEFTPLAIDRKQADGTLLVMLTDAQLSRQGTVSDELFVRL